MVSPKCCTNEKKTHYTLHASDAFFWIYLHRDRLKDEKLKAKDVSQNQINYRAIRPKVSNVINNFFLKRTTFYDVTHKDMSYCRSTWTLNIEFLKFNLVHYRALSFWHKLMKSKATVPFKILITPHFWNKAPFKGKLSFT